MQSERVEFLTKEIIKYFPSEIEVSNTIVNYIQHTSQLWLKSD